MSNNDEKYYVPNIEDIRIGYEIEGKAYGGEELWFKLIINAPNWADMLCSKDCDGIYTLPSDIYRVPFLTKEQIEQEGYRTDHISDTGMYFFFDDITHVLKICDYNGDMSYNGECKSINEFRYICKLLKI